MGPVVVEKSPYQRGQVDVYAPLLDQLSHERGDPLPDEGNRFLHAHLQGTVRADRIIEGIGDVDSRIDECAVKVENNELYRHPIV